MPESSLRVLVTGATGHQGGATLRALLQRGVQVRALTRDPSSPAAQAVAKLGAEVVKGDLDDRGSLDRALAGMEGAFAVQTMMGKGGVEKEERQGKAFADAAQAAGVKHLVYSSVGAADRKTGIPHFESKWRIEEHIRAIGVPATILRPVFFMDNLAVPRAGRMIFLGLLRAAIPAEKPLALIAVADIGELAAIALTQRERFLGKAIELAGDSLTVPQIQAAIARKTAKPERRLPLPALAVRALPHDFRVMLQWFGTHGYDTPLEPLRAIHPGLTTFQTWLGQTGQGPRPT